MPKNHQGIEKPWNKYYLFLNVHLDVVVPDHDLLEHVVRAQMGDNHLQRLHALPAEQNRRRHACTLRRPQIERREVAAVDGVALDGLPCFLGAKDETEQKRVDDVDKPEHNDDGWDQEAKADTASVTGIVADEKVGAEEALGSDRDGAGILLNVMAVFVHVNLETWFGG